MTRYQNLFQPIQVGPVRLKNRIVMPPMANNLCNADGTLSPASIAYYTERAKGGVGLIIVECSAVAFPRGLIVERQPNINSRNVMPDWRRLAESVHSYGAKIIVQIHHGGFLADPMYNGGEMAVAPSDYDGGDWFPARALTHDEVKDIIDKHIAAAEMLHDAGLDGVEVHCSSTYLINEFLTPYYNHRTDEYGGSLENRARILTDIISGIKERCPDFMVSTRLAIEDKEIPDGLSLEDGVEIAKLCEKAGADMINCTVGFFFSQHLDTESQWQNEGGRLYMAEAVKKEITTAKVAAVGKFRTPAFCDEVIRDGRCDLVCLGRQHICDPFWAKKLESGHEEEIRTCLCCNDGCVNEALIRHGSVRCAINPFAGYESIFAEHTLPKAGTAKKVVVAGGGIAGMQAAIVAAKRGHEVILLEKSQRLGGQMIYAGAMKQKDYMRRALAWFRREVGRLPIDVRFGTEAKADGILALNPDAVIVAVGASCACPPVSGAKDLSTAWQVLDDPEMYKDAKSAVIIGGGAVGCETAVVLSEAGISVTILEKLDDICKDEEPMHRVFVEGYLKEHAAVHTGVEVKGVKAEPASAAAEVVFADAEGETQTVRADLAVTACGSRSLGDELYNELAEADVDVYRIGDSYEIGNLRSATRRALDAAYLI